QGVRGAGSRSEKTAGGARGIFERGAGQGHRGSERGKGTRGRRIGGGKERDRSERGATGRGDRAACIAGAASTGEPGERGTMSRGGLQRALLAAAAHRASLAGLP